MSYLDFISIISWIICIALCLLAICSNNLHTKLYTCIILTCLTCICVGVSIAQKEIISTMVNFSIILSAANQIFITANNLSHRNNSYSMLIKGENSTSNTSYGIFTTKSAIEKNTRHILANLKEVECKIGKIQSVLYSDEDFVVPTQEVMEYIHNYKNSDNGNSNTSKASEPDSSLN